MNINHSLYNATTTILLRSSGSFWAIALLLLSCMLLDTPAQAGNGQSSQVTAKAKSQACNNLVKILSKKSKYSKSKCMKTDLDKMTDGCLNKGQVARCAAKAKDYEALLDCKYTTCKRASSPAIDAKELCVCLQMSKKKPGFESLCMQKDNEALRKYAGDEVKKKQYQQAKKACAAK